MSAAKDFEAAKQLISVLTDKYDMTLDKTLEEPANLYHALRYFIEAVEKDMNTIKSRLAELDRRAS